MHIHILNLIRKIHILKSCTAGIFYFFDALYLWNLGQQLQVLRDHDACLWSLVN